MNKFVLTITFLLAGFMIQAGPLWMRYPKISPDGKQIVFSYKGDIYVVSSDGGEARQLTTHPAHESHPVWSPDGKQIAFTSDRFGNFDIFVMPALERLVGLRLIPRARYLMPLPPTGKRLFTGRNFKTRHKVPCSPVAR